MATFKEYRDEMNRIFARYIRGGFVDYYHCRGLGNDMISLMINATEELSSRGEYKELFDLANKGFLKWGKTNKDDSDGETQDFEYYVEQAWDQVYEANDSRMPHTKMYDWFEKHIDNSVIDYMEDCLYEYLVHHFTEPELLQKKYDFLTGKIKEGLERKEDYYHEFQVSRCQEYLLYVMADMDKPIADIRKYAKNLKSYSIQETMAEIEKRYGNMDAVISIYKNLAEEEDKRGWARDNWHKKLMEIYKELGDEKMYRAELLSAMALNIGDEALWKEYKHGFSAEEWPEACENIFSNVSIGNYRIFPWYAMEERYDLIMKGIEAGGHIDRLMEYEKKLKILYPERCLKVLVKRTEEMAELSNKRQDYRRVAKNLRWMQDYPGGKEKAAELVAGFRAKYKRRRAMMEEIAAL